jgi:hypothetical protein
MPRLTIIHQMEPRISCMSADVVRRVGGSSELRLGMVADPAVQVQQSFQAIGTVAGEAVQAALDQRRDA